jgi:hypothetical protein
MTRLIAAVCLFVIACRVSAQDGAALTLLADNAAKAAIVDEKIEPYFSLLCLHEMEVKGGLKLEGKDLDAKREAFKQHYTENVGDFTDMEKDMLTDVVGHVHRALKEDYPGFTAYPWSLIKVTNAVEQGLPHTRGKSIILPEGFLTQALEMYHANKEQSLLFLVNLMVHEQVHVVQRLKPKPFEAFYTEQWELEHVDAIVYGDYLNDRQLINPDGVDTRWVQNIGTSDAPRYIQPNVILERFEDRPSRMPNDFKQVAIELKQDDAGTWRPIKAEDGQPVIHPLHGEAGYMQHYGVSKNVYHPNESFADLFALAVLYDDFIPAGAIEEKEFAEINEALDPVRELMAKTFGPVNE